MTDEIQPFTGGHIICDNAVLENEGIIFEGCIFYADRITPDISALYWVDDGPTLSSSVPKRVAEFTAGQICASRALARQGYSAKVPGRSRRIPVWPAGICGSISHTDTLACAIVTASDRWRALGVDVESVMTPALAHELRHAIVAEGEDDEPPPTLSQEQFITLLFSGKEAAFKAINILFPGFIDFREVKIIFDWAQSLFRIIYCGERKEVMHDVHLLQGLFFWYQDSIITIVRLPHL
ncbi:4'-phosphopantetheinyl transferase superfamily protein [Enterobacter cloacae]|uniref:4'-phosphopantetheinyl transferase family protein n=1 Tax=Enterobacter cloacae TaxID=550 RepID=UPI000D380114|nr:4'-phosphopantetheinyl transferase superfamily protein [Enterobacter cloacae]QCC92802.1 4'-phosphopantetheinyl transferase superfamily protein [Enterobacter cloacae]QCC97802.1 4'-phosphopantetheinyl transferase superfamily protein [Enterobacter cloacae]QCD10267.1 4'-phosphopantetheinyl transferase superfamily protein [Enterobacter cloacae]